MESISLTFVWVSAKADLVSGPWRGEEGSVVGRVALEGAGLIGGLGCTISVLG